MGSPISSSTGASFRAREPKNSFLPLSPTPEMPLPTFGETTPDSTFTLSSPPPSSKRVAEALPSFLSVSKKVKLASPSEILTFQLQELLSKEELPEGQKKYLSVLLADLESADHFHDFPSYINKKERNSNPIEFEESHVPPLLNFWFLKEFALCLCPEFYGIDPLEIPPEDALKTFTRLYEVRHKILDCIENGNTVLNLYKACLNTFPSALFHHPVFKSTLKILNLSENPVGFIEEICLLENLQQLDLNNSVVTAIPETIDKLKNLIHLFLNNNYLSYKSFPLTFKNLSLHTLDISHNELPILPFHLPPSLHHLKISFLPNPETFFQTLTSPYFFKFPYLKILCIEKNDPKQQETSPLYTDEFFHPPRLHLLPFFSLPPDCKVVFKNQNQIFLDILKNIRNAHFHADFSLEISSEYNFMDHVIASSNAYALTYQNPEIRKLDQEKVRWNILSNIKRAVDTLLQEGLDFSYSFEEAAYYAGDADLFLSHLLPVPYEARVSSVPDAERYTSPENILEWLSFVAYTLASKLKELPSNSIDLFTPLSLEKKQLLENFITAFNLAINFRELKEKTVNLKLDNINLNKKLFSTLTSLFSLKVAISSLSLKNCSLKDSDLLFGKEGIVYAFRSSLTHLDVSHNSLTKIENLKPLTHLQTLNISNNPLTEMPVSIFDLPKGCKILVDGDIGYHSFSDWCAKHPEISKKAPEITFLDLP